MTKHLHKLERFKTKNGGFLYRCMIPGCKTFYSVPEVLIGTQIACLVCGGSMYATPENMKLKKLICLNCRVDRARRQSA